LALLLLAEKGVLLILLLLLLKLKGEEELFVVVEVEVFVPNGVDEPLFGLLNTPGPKILLELVVVPDPNTLEADPEDSSMPSSEGFKGVAKLVVNEVEEEVLV